MYALLLLAFFLICVIYIWMKRPTKLNLPGPAGLPILGNLLQLDAVCPHEHLTRWARKYGGAYCISLMGTNWVVVSSYDYLQAMFVKQGIQFGNRPRTFRALHCTFGLKSLIVAHSDDYFHTVAKRTIHRSLKLHSGGAAKMEQVVSTMLDDFINKMQQTDRKPHNPKIDIYNFTLQSLLYFTIGRFVEDGNTFFRMGRQMERLYVTSGIAAGQGSELDAFPFLRIFPNKTYKKALHAMEIAGKIWDLVKPILNIDEQNSVMESMLLVQKEDLRQTGNLTIDDDNMKALLMDILVAGTTTTSNSLTAFINIMVHYPEVQDKIYQEVNAVVGSARAVAIQDRQNMPYVRATIYELNRYVSVVPLGVPHAAADDCKLAGVVIPKGTCLIPNTWALHHDDTFWGDPWTFRPDRFLDEHGQLLPADHVNRRNLLPFGAGPRVCVGEIFAMSRMFLFIASVLQHFTIKPAPGDKVPCDPRGYIIGTALSPNDFHVCFTERD